MNASRWQLVGEIYHQALALDAEARNVYLKRACEGDADLRREVESLLARASDASGFLETPALELTGRALAAQQQRAMIGRRLGQYEIRSFIGAGGMGEVYLGCDTRLERDVAIKCLPGSVALEPGARARLEREARLLATLNHHNIAAIHGVEEAGGLLGLILEFVPGRTLAELAGTFELPDALAIIRQIADALEAAHARGVIHRDLKPANIKITPTGVVKVLDFGLAKALDEAPGNRDQPTREHTRTGVILGTAAYMSPEQARGKALDQRTDVWAFGCVAYELITRRAAFGAETSTDSLVKVLESEPDWTVLPDATPSSVRRMLRRCLAKDPAVRLRDIADARLELDEALAPPASTSGAARPQRQWRYVASVLAILAIAAVAATAGYVISRGQPTSPPGAVSRLTFGQGNIGKARFTPDGQGVIYSASWDGQPFRLYSTRLGGAQSRTIDLPPSDLLAVSRQGQLAIAMGRPAVDGFEPHGILAVTAIAGGAPRELYTNVVGADWSADGKTMALVRRVGERAQLEFPLGSVVFEAVAVMPPRISPNGEHVCFFGGAAYGELWLAERGQPARRLANDLQRGGHCAWTPDGREIWVESGGGAWHMSIEAFDLNGGRRVVASYTGTVQIEDISADGKVLVTAGSTRFSVTASQNGERERDVSVFDATRTIDIRADGQQVLLWDNSPGAGLDRILVRDLSGAAPVAIGPGAPVALSIDGAWAAVVGNGETNERVRDKLTLLPTGVGARRTIDMPVALDPINAGSLGRTDWSRRNYAFSDGGERFLIPSGKAADRPSRIYVYDFQRQAIIPISPEGVLGPAVISGDGRSVAVSEASTVNIYDVDAQTVRSIAGPPETGNVAAWSADGQSLFVIDQEESTARLYRRDLVRGTRTLLREIRAQSPAGVTAFDVFVSRNGLTYAYTTMTRLANVYVIEGLR